MFISNSNIVYPILQISKSNEKVFYLLLAPLGIKRYPNNLTSVIWMYPAKPIILDLNIIPFGDEI